MCEIELKIICQNILKISTMSLLVATLAIQQDRRNMLRMRRRRLRDSTDPFSIPEARFIELFRFSRATVRKLLVEMEPLMDTAVRNTFIPNSIRLCVALHYYATGSYLRDVGQDFVCAVSKAMVSRILHQVTKILQNYLAQRYIIFPTTLEQQNIVKKRFPGVLGAIDCTHVKIKKPSSDVEYCYINRKGYFSKNVQLVCDFDLNILGCFARYGGSTHDAYIWESSKIKSHILKAYTANDSTGWFLGDSTFYARTRVLCI
ncbi:PREDICTED: putative nuclease HARBI1 [Rhagoletis zephyria]|uniref:putative nuclease HARBI1 n=1 Tax=Rhagoletis zephyria TaxID=28612 RepID=UPI0008112B74|nr:PREDICTED: putative nuclease HARBI1 [Rhagoletis zephyria]